MPPGCSKYITNLAEAKNKLGQLYDRVMDNRIPPHLR
jgi:hypothetical protein